MNHYERLGVDRDVDAVGLQRAYRRLAAERHPDRNPDDVEAATRDMALINEAFDVLRDPVARFDYNRQLDRPAGSRVTVRRRGPSGATHQGPPDDDPVRRARREAKEREAAEAKERGYRDPGGGFFEGLDFH